MKIFKKSTLTLIIAVLLCCTVFPVSTNATDLKDQTVSVEYLENGDCIETVISVETSDNPVLAVYSSTKTATKTNYYKNSSGDVLWSVSIKGTFSYNGNASSCTSCSHSTTAPSSVWYIKSASHSKSGNTATAKATAAKKTSTGIKEYSMSVTIKCSANGTIS